MRHNAYNVATRQLGVVLATVNVTNITGDELRGEVEVTFEEWPIIFHIRHLISQDFFICAFLVLYLFFSLSPTANCVCCFLRVHVRR